MASNRSSTKKHALAAETHGARHRRASRRAHPDRRVAAAGKAIAGWAQAADRFAQAVGDELLRRVDGETDSRELIVRVASRDERAPSRADGAAERGRRPLRHALSRASIDT